MSTAADRPRPGRTDDALIPALVLAAVALRLAWLARTGGGVSGFAADGEATRVALTLARTSWFADAFWPGSGPTAHLTPLAPLPAAAVFRLFAPEGAFASLLLLGWSLAQSLGGYLLMRRLFVRLGAPPAALRWALVSLLVLPVFAGEETIAFRYWDGAAAVCLSALALPAAFAVERGGPLAAGGAAVQAALWATTVMVSPVVALALALVWAWVALRRLPFREAARFANCPRWRELSCWSRGRCATRANSGPRSSCAATSGWNSRSATIPPR